MGSQGRWSSATDGRACGEGVMEIVGVWVAVRRFKNGGKVMGGGCCLLSVRGRREEEEEEGK